MASDGGNSFPFTALSIVAIFLSTAFLGQRAFDLWRPADTSPRKHVELPEPPVEARLWEDPLSAMARFHDRIRDSCAAAKGIDAAECEKRRTVAPEQLKARLEEQAQRATVTVMAVLVPGAALVGTEEGRRRFRYAVLSGLNREGFNPDDSEHMGLLRTVHLPDFGSESRGSLDIVFETLHRWGTHGDPNDPERRVVVLWIDDSKFRPRWLSGLVRLFDSIAPGTARLSILGPVNSDALAKAVWNDAAAWADEVAGSANREDFKRYLGIVQRLAIASPLATAAPETLGLLPCEKGDCVENLLRDHAARAAQALGLTWDREAFSFTRTVATDDRLIARLADELRARGLDACAPGRVVLISERDLIYARHFGDALKSVLTCKDSSRTQLRLWTYSYFRGLDGATPERTAEQARTLARSSSDDGRKRPPIEWPEGQAQEDYVRRLVDDIRADNGREPVVAIGLVGLEVHDKLLLAQALRETFSDRPVFMTDLDARMVHPITSRYTRNVIVASSLALQVDEQRLRCRPDEPRPAPSVSAVAPRPSMAVVDRSIPFRDAYQTSMFLAARYAVANPVDKARLAACLPGLLARPMLFELGRSGMVELPTAGVSEGEAHQRLLFAAASGAFFALLAVVMLFGLPGPAMAAVRGWLMPSYAEPEAAFAWPKAIVAALQWAALSFAFGVVLELARPGTCDGIGLVLLAASGFVFALAFLYPGTGWVQRLRRALQSDAAGGRAAGLLRVVVQMTLFAGLVAGAWTMLVPPAPADAVYEPFSLLNGVSSWPSLLIRTLMIVLFAWFLDFAWFQRLRTARDLRRSFFGPARQDTIPDRAPTRWGRFCAWLGCLTVWFWRPRIDLGSGRIDGARLWESYHRMMDDGPRLARLLAWLILSAGLTAALVFFANTVSDSADPAIPARGLADRNILLVTQVIGVVCLLVLLILVGDETILTWRFVACLRQGRTVYPEDTVRRFARELGPEIADKAAAPIAARPRERDAASAAGQRNSILDDWIDARLLADHTAAVGPLIVYPFILVALLIVARSQIFDNWDMGPGVLAVMVCYLLWSIGMAALLNHGAERARRKALDGMQADLLWLNGTGAKDLSGSFKELVESVKGLRKGAFAPFFEQPMVRAILVPLGGAGGIQLLEFLLYART